MNSQMGWKQRGWNYAICLLKVVRANGLEVIKMGIDKL